MILYGRSWLLARILMGSIVLFSNLSVASTRVIELPTILEDVSGVVVQFPSTGEFTVRSNCKMLEARIHVGLNDLGNKALSILKRSGVEQNNQCGDMVAVNKVRMNRAGTNLRFDVTGNVAREECVYATVPELNGLSVSFKNKLIANTTFGSKARVTAEVQPVINKNNTLGLILVGAPGIQVENETYQYLISALGLQTQIEADLKKAFQIVLNNNQQFLQLPPSLEPFGIRLKSTQVLSSTNGLVLQVRGNVPVPTYLAPAALSLLGFERNICTKTR